MTIPFYKALLKDSLAHRCRQNPRYSLRAFARSLRMDASTLSRVLSDRSRLSLESAQRVSRILCLSPEEKSRFLRSLFEEQGAGGALKAASGESLGVQGAEFDPLDSERFRAVADWYHYAILELTYVKRFQFEARWIAKELGIPVTQAKLAMERLVDLGLLRVRSGVVAKSNSRIWHRASKMTAEALMQHQKQVLHKAVDALENEPMERRCMTSLTLPLRVSDIDTARELIENFVKKLCKSMGSDSYDEVFQLQIAFFPLQKRVKS